MGKEKQSKHFHKHIPLAMGFYFLFQALIKIQQLLFNEKKGNVYAQHRLLFPLQCESVNVGSGGSPLVSLPSFQSPPHQ